MQIPGVHLRRTPRSIHSLIQKAEEAYPLMSYGDHDRFFDKKIRPRIFHTQSPRGPVILGRNVFLKQVLGDKITGICFDLVRALYWLLKPHVPRGVDVHPLQMSIGSFTHIVLGVAHRDERGNRCLKMFDPSTGHTLGIDDIPHTDRIYNPVRGVHPWAMRTVWRLVSYTDPSRLKDTKWPLYNSSLLGHDGISPWGLVAIQEGNSLRVERFRNSEIPVPNKPHMNQEMKYVSYKGVKIPGVPPIQDLPPMFERIKDDNSKEFSDKEWDILFQGHPIVFVRHKYPSMTDVYDHYGLFYT